MICPVEGSSRIAGHREPSFGTQRDALSRAPCTMKRFFRTVLVSRYRLLLRLWWPILRRCHAEAKTKRVLLCVDTPLRADYADENARLIRDDPRLATWMTGPTNAGFPSSALRELAGKSRHRCVPYWVARAQWWDQIIFADYRAADRFHPDVRKVLVNHFLGGGKIIGGKEYRFERKLSHLGRPLFTSILEASHAARQRAITAQPVLANHVRVVGD